MKRRLLICVMALVVCGALRAAPQIHLLYTCPLSPHGDWDKKQADTSQGHWPPTLDFKNAKTWGDLEAQIEPYCGPGRLLLYGAYPGKDHPFVQPKSFQDYGAFLTYIPQDSYEGEATHGQELEKAGIPSQEDFLAFVTFHSSLGRMQWQEAKDAYERLPDIIKFHPEVVALYRFMEAYTRKDKPVGLPRSLNVKKTYCWGHEDAPVSYHAQANSWRDLEDGMILTMGLGRLMVDGALPSLDEAIDGKTLKKAEPLVFASICPTSESTLMELAVLSGLLARGAHARARVELVQDDVRLQALRKAPFFDKMEAYLKARP